MESEHNAYFRESLEELSWPVMVRGLRQYLTRLAEDDGALIRNHSDALEALLRALRPHPHETEAVRAALALLVKKGLLLAEQTSVFVRDLRPPPDFARARPDAPAPAKRSTERVRKYRERLRRARLLAAATTIGAVTPSCSNGGVIEPLVEIKLFANLTPISTSGPRPASAKCLGGKER